MPVAVGARVEVPGQHDLDVVGIRALYDPHVLAELVDVTEEVVAVHALRANERLLRRLTESLPVGVLYVDVDRRVVYANTQLRAIVGIDNARDVDEQLAGIAPADRGPVREAIDGALLRGDDADVEVTFQTPPGRPAGAC